jgi:hypothetical protein
VSDTHGDDLEAVKVVMARYFRFMDTKQWSDLRGTFTDDMTMHAPDDVADAPVVEGGDRVARVIERVLGPAVSVHRGYMPEVEFEGPDAAHAIWAMQDVVEYPDSPERNFSGSGHYHATYLRTSDGWKIRSLVLRRLRLDRS